MSPFRQYAGFYDLLYRDKDYATEAAYVAATLRAAAPAARSILEFGCGTGRHGRLLARDGFEVHGIERSREMVALACGGANDPMHPGAFTCELGDICSTRIGRSFDAVISLFHVISYQADDDEVLAAFRSAADHLAPGGLFLFDVWHGPAVLAEGPSVRTKEVDDGGRYRVRRTARPFLDTDRNVVKVLYDMQCSDRETGERAEFTEEHVMRYFFPGEIDCFARACGLTRIASEEFLTRRTPSTSTWSVVHLLRR